MISCIYDITFPLTNDIFFSIHEDTMKKIKKANMFAAILIFIYILSLIPILYLGRYNYPCADDFGFSAACHIAWENSRSVFRVLKTAFATAADRWFTWQGTFSTIFLMALQPAVWGEGGYCLVPWIMIGALTLSTLFFLHTLLVRVLHIRPSLYLCLSMLYLIFVTQCMIDKTQAFFWYNGAAHYILPHSAALVLAGTLLLLLTDEKNRIIRLLLGCFLSFFIGGGNLVTALITGILFAVSFLLLMLMKKQKSALLLLPSILVFAGAFLLNAAAPGNAVRQSMFADHPGPVKAVLLSFYYCTEYLADTWFNWTWLVYLLLLLPFIWKAVRNVGNRFSYPFPLLVSAFSYCLLSAMFTPNLYATGSAGSGRIFNIIFLDTALLAAGNLFYIMGWLRTHRMKSVCPEHSSPEDKDVRLYLGAVLLFAAFMLLTYVKVSPDFFTSSSAAASLLSGEAAAYGRECENRTRLIREADSADLTLPRFSEMPYLLYYSDIEPDPSDWKNTSMARYYQMDSITATITQANH